MTDDNINISWKSPIIPSKSLAGIPIGIENGLFQHVLEQYLVDSENKIYEFNYSPALILDEYILDDNGNGYYHFVLNDPKLTGRGNPTQLRDSFYSRVLNIGVVNNHIAAIKTWAFEVLVKDDQKSIHSYMGKTKEGLGLYSPLIDFLNYSELVFDEGESFFYTDGAYGNLEITGYGQTLEDYPDQVVMAIAVF